MNICIVLSVYVIQSDSPHSTGKWILDIREKKEVTEKVRQTNWDIHLNFFPIKGENNKKNTMGHNPEDDRRGDDKQIRGSRRRQETNIMIVCIDLAYIPSSSRDRPNKNLFLLAKVMTFYASPALYNNKCPYSMRWRANYYYYSCCHIGLPTPPPPPPPPLLNYRSNSRGRSRTKNYSQNALLPYRTLTHPIVHILCQSGFQTPAVEDREARQWEWNKRSSTILLILQHIILILLLLLAGEEMEERKFGGRSGESILPKRYFSQSDENLFYVCSMIKWAIATYSIREQTTYTHPGGFE